MQVFMAVPMTTSAAGVFVTGDKVIAGVIVTGDKLFTGINDTGDH
jgi:hypothetical protein